MKALFFLVLVTVVLAEDSCPAWRDWRPWTDECLFFKDGGLDHMRQKWLDACDISVPEEFRSRLPVIEGMPSACGHCSFKVRCRKRPRADNCIPIESEKQVCHDGAHGEVCTFPEFPLHNLGCRYEFASLYLQQCANRHDLPEFKRDAMRKMGNLMPNFHCTDSEGQCKCCCHPYVPNEDGSACEEIVEPECEAYSAWTGWSDTCAWFPLDELRDNMIEHCELDYDPKKAKNMMKHMKIPEAIKDAIPERCGYCSFRFKCRKRSVLSAAGNKECFPMEMQKKACGEDDCEGCADVCVLPKVMGSCNITQTLRKVIGPSIKSTMKKLPHSIRDGLMHAIAHMPHGKCIEKDDKCHCCCHPYEPNEDGSECVLKQMCKSPEDLGHEVDLNLDAESFFWL